MKEPEPSPQGMRRVEGRRIETHVSPPRWETEDIAVVVDEATPASQVQETILAGGGKLLVDVRLFDVYRGDQIDTGKKSLAYALTFQAEDRTLTDKEVAKVQARIVLRLERELGAKLRA